MSSKRSCTFLLTVIKTFYVLYLFIIGIFLEWLLYNFCLAIMGCPKNKSRSLAGGILLNTKGHINLLNDLFYSLCVLVLRHSIIHSFIRVGHREAWTYDHSYISLVSKKVLAEMFARIVFWVSESSLTIERYFEIFWNTITCAINNVRQLPILTYVAVSEVWAAFQGNFFTKRLLWHSSFLYTLFRVFSPNSFSQQ